MFEKKNENDQSTKKIGNLPSDCLSKPLADVARFLVSPNSLSELRRVNVELFIATLLIEVALWRGQKSCSNLKKMCKKVFCLPSCSPK